MKKLLVFAFAAVAAVAVQAATLNWGGGIYNQTLAGGDALGDGTDAISAGSVMQLYLLSDSTTTTADVGDYDYYTGKLALNNGGTATLMDSHTVTSEESESYTGGGVFSRDDANGGVNGTWLTLIYDPSTASSAFVQGISTVTGVSDTTQAGDALNYDYVLTTVQAFSSEPAPIPEPTSVALLALGLAALGLKRKVA